MESRQVGPPLLAFNYLPVRFTATGFDGGVVPFESPEQLAKLRAELADGHVVVKTRSQIACVPRTADATLYGAPTTFLIRDHQSLTMRLVQEAMLHAVIGWGYKLRRLSPPMFVSRLPGKDLLSSAVRDRQAEGLAALHVYPQFRLDARVHGPSGRPGVIVGVKTRYEIDLTVAELIRYGIDVVGRYVLGHDDTAESHPALDQYATRHTVGAVDTIDGDDLVLRDAPGVSRIAADAAWLEGRRDIFLDVVTKLAGPDGPDGPRIVHDLEQASFDLLGAVGRLGKIIDIATRLARRGPIEIANGLFVTIEQPVGASSNGRRVASSRYDPPTFRFDQAGDKTSRSPDRGLDENGPFDVEFFPKKKPRIAVVTPRAHKGTVETFMTKFLHGMPGAKVSTKGFIRKYHLSGAEVTMHAFPSDARDAAAYRQACRDALRDGPPDLAIVITSQAQEHLTGDDSPYLVAKSCFMGQGVPVQDVQIETIRQSNLAYALNSIALACYAKLGGIPFVLAAPRTLAHELVIGIGSAHVKASRLTTPERVVGVTAVFSADGNYLLSNTSREADYADYPRELLRSLTECITDIEARNAWQKGDELRLVFHVFKPLKDTEMGIRLAMLSFAEEVLSAYMRGDRIPAPSGEARKIKATWDEAWKEFEAADSATGPPEPG